MSYLVFNTRARMLQFTSSVDADVGYPKDGCQCGPGPHAPKTLTRTLRQVDALEHPTLAQWAIPEDGAVRGKLGRIALPVGTVRVPDLDDTWYPDKPAAIAVVEEK